MTMAHSGSHWTRDRVCLIALCAVSWLACAGCGDDGRDEGATPAQDSLLFDLTGIPVSDQLTRALRDEAPDASSAAPSDRESWTGWAATLALADELEVAVQRPATREAAGDSLYALWREQPDNLCWIQTAVRYNYLLHRDQDRDVMLARLAANDSTSPATAFARGYRFYGRGSRGEHFRTAAARASELDGLGQVLLICKLAMVEADEGAVLQAVDRLLATLPRCRPAGPWLRMRIWYDVATYLEQADRLDDAMHAAAAGVRACRATGSEFWWGRFLILSATLREARRETEAALALFEEGSRFGETSDLHWIFVNSTYKAASLCSSIGDIERALHFDRLALAHCVSIQDSLNAPRNMMNISDDFRMLGQLDSCLVYQEHARRWVDASDDARNRARLPLKAAEFHCQVGNYAIADSLLALARNRSSTASLAIDEAELLLRMIKQGLDMGQPDLAYQAIDRLAALYDVLHDKHPDQNQVADYETTTVEFLTGQGEYALAHEALVRAGAAITRGGGEGKAWRYHRCAGELALKRGDMKTAETEFTRCLDLARRIDNPGLESASRFHLGHYLLQNDRNAEACELFTVAADSGRYGDRFRQRLETLVFLGRALAREGSLYESVAQLRRAEALLTPHTPADLFSLVHYELGNSLAAMGAWEEAQTILLSAKDRLDEATRTSRPELMAFSESLHRDIVTALVDLTLHPSDSPPGQDRIRSALALAMELKPFDSGTEDPVRRLTADGSCAAVYLVGRERSYLWVVREGDVAVNRLPGRAELAGLIAPVLADLTTPLRTVDEEAITRLASLLLGPVMPAWEQDRLLRISADDLLASLPWGALPIDAAGNPALTRGPIIEVEAWCDVPRERPGAGPVLAVGLDGHGGGSDAPADLRHAEAEARAVAALWPADRVILRTGEAATWSALLAADLAEASVLHLATHAVVHQGASERASLRLAGRAGSTPVPLRSLADLDLKADLIYLSCCEGAQTSRPGAGLTGFARAFLAAGARPVIASTIRVDDEASLELARHYYTNWLQGMSKASALRAAQLALREARPAWGHPYYWSFYRIIGEAG